MTSALLIQWIQHPEQLNRDTLYELRTLVARYPYFQTARMLFLKNLYLLHDESFGTELRKSVLFVADRALLFQLIEGERYNIATSARPDESRAKPDEEEPSDRTLTLIDAFLATMPQESQPADMNLDYSMDYTAFLTHGAENETSADTVPADTPEVPKFKGQELIDGFLQNDAATSAPVTTRQTDEDGYEPAPISSAEGLDDSCFTETLAKIYIKQHRYDKALEIIKKLSLNYPKKNAYFADQIRFLEKLIINAKSK